jgi:hypothetical protein
MGQPSTIRRIWLTITPCHNPGRVGLSLSPIPPRDVSNCMAVLMTRGDLPPGWPLELDVVSDPSADPSLKGKPGDPGKAGDPGLSAYQLARQQGYGGTLTQWLASLIGASGASAYEIARAAGYGGTQAQWLATLRGDPGTPATTLLGTLPVGESSIVTLSAGLRRVTVTTPASWGVAVGQDLMINAIALPSAAYALHDVIVIAANTISVGVTTPVLSVLSTYAIQCRVRRLN